MTENRAKPKLIFWIVGVAIVIAALLSIATGKYPISLREMWLIMTGGEVKPMTVRVFTNLRLPRTVMAVLAGAGLGLAGAVYQTIFKNPLASPDIIGVSSGANLGAAVMIVTFGTDILSLTSGAFIGGLLAVAFVMLMVRATGSVSTSTYVLAGIIISAVAKAFIMMIKYYSDASSELATIEYWTMGTLSSITLDKLLYTLPFWVVGYAGLILMRRQVALLSLNEEECRSLGVRIRSVRIAVLLLSTLLVASIISVTGLISFTGLIAPHIANMMLKRQNTAYLVMSSLVGALVMLCSDMLARSLTAAEMPISILTTIIGVPVLVWFMLRRRSGRV